MQPTILLLAALLLTLAATAQAGPSAPKGLELDSGQARLLKDAEYYLKDVDKAVPPLLEQAQALHEGRATMTKIELQKGLNGVQYAGQKLNNALTRLQQLPAAEPAVKAVSDRVTQRSQELLAIEHIFTAAGEGKAQAAAAVNASALRADTDKMRAIGTKVAYADAVMRNPEGALETIRELSQLEAFRKQMGTTYGPILGESEGSNMKAAIDAFDYSLPNFKQGIAGFAPTVAQTFETELETIGNMIDIAEERRSVSSFVNGSLQSQFDRATLRAHLYEAIVGKTEARSLRKQLTAMEQRITKAHKELRTEILASNVAPKDLYTGADKKELLALVAKAWKRAHGKQKVLATAIPMRKWERWSGVRWAQDHYQLIDESSLQVAIVVQADKELAHVYYAHLKRDHQAQDHVTVVLDDRGDVPLYRTLLLSNL